MADDLTSRLAAVSGGNSPAPAGQPTQNDDLTSRLQQVSGTAPVSMTGPNGEQVQVPQNQVDDMRAKNFAVNASPSTQLMITPEGKLTNALPDEVDKFKASGHVPVNPDGTFTVAPLPGEDNTDTMDRAARIAKNLPPDVMKQAIAAEQKTFTAKRLAANLVAGPAIAGFGGAAALTGGAEATGAAIEAAPLVGRAAIQAAKTPVGKVIIKEAVGHVAPTAVTYYLLKKLFG